MNNSHCCFSRPAIAAPETEKKSSSSKSPQVSVIIPSYNRREMLEEAIHSVKQQSFTDWELIVVDDGSSDDTWSWLNDVQNKLPNSQQNRNERVRAIQLPVRHGPAKARNIGAQNAGGEYLAFLDSDDLFLPQKLERQVALMQQDFGIVLCHSDEIWLRDGQELKQQKKHEKKGGNIFAHCLPLCRISPSATIIRKNIFLELGGFDEELEIAEDYEFWLRLTCRFTVGFIAEPLIIKRGGHSDQLSQKYGQIEKFRIEALRRVIASGCLNTEQRQLALTMLQEKCRIYALGCEKRGRCDEAIHFRRLPDQLAQE